MYHRIFQGRNESMKSKKSYRIKLKKNKVNHNSNKKINNKTNVKKNIQQTESPFKNWINKVLNTSLAALTAFNTTPLVNAHNQNINPSLTYNQPILADLTILKKAGIPVLYKDQDLDVGYAVINEADEQKISLLAHANKRCGNYEKLYKLPNSIQEVESNIQQLRSARNKFYQNSISQPFFPQFPNEELKAALENQNISEIQETMNFLTSFKSRYNKLPDPNQHIEPFIQRLSAIAQMANYPIQIETVNHNSTKQKSIKVTILGSTQPQEIVVLGGHLDSISGWSSTSSAPGADDNASGSASLFNAFKTLVQLQQPKRTIQFFWYAGEESGLLGSSEIADTAKNNNHDIIAVLQLDMTSFAGDGANVITSMTDFTSPWLRDFLLDINKKYLQITIQEDRCGYGCSDHASWFRRGYPTLFPTESKFNTSFPDIHTPKDVISPKISFNHALIFSKIATAFAFELANSEQRQPSN